MKPVCRDFSIAFWVAAVVLVGGSLLLRSLAGVDLTRATTVLIVVSAAFWAGARHGRRTLEPVQGGFAALATLAMLALGLAFSAVLGGIIIMMMPAADLEALRATIRNMPPQWHLVLPLVGLLVSFGVIRFFFGKAAKTSAIDARRAQGLERL